ncbi:hypothetical protein SAMN05444158_7371 [Bradyrhizobium canariense]|uniref:Uncharacterized protein n=1 Tax=Bradyrhizobium canariense TaxID=255045 RepID=A0A1H2BNU0_9BRAD|nr:hypothetical protein SAMN05444158_7371 [Bradyrhizobium canariense]
MRISKLLWITMFGVSMGSGTVWAQGTKDPSNPVPSMVFPIRPRDEPAPSTAVPNTSHTRRQGTVQLQPIYRYPGYRARVRR